MNTVQKWSGKFICLCLPWSTWSDLIWILVLPNYWLTFDRLSDHWASVIFICEIKVVTSVMQSCLKLQLLIPLKMCHLWHCALAISTHSQHSPSLAQDMVLWMGPQIWWESEFMPWIKWTWYRHRSPACWGSSGLGGGWDVRVWLQQWEFYLGPAVSTLDECTGEKNMHGLVCEVRAVTAQDLGVCWTSETYWGQQDFGSQSKI